MYKAVIIQIPLLDMLAYEHLSAGASWVGEYGSVSVPEERAFLAAISPYNQLRPDVNYPEPLLLTTTADDRVGPVHARKFAARLSEFNKPFLYSEITEGGPRRRRRSPAGSAYRGSVLHLLDDEAHGFQRRRRRAVTRLV